MYVTYILLTHAPKHATKEIFDFQNSDCMYHNDSQCTGYCNISSFAYLSSVPIDFLKKSMSYSH